MCMLQNTINHIHKHTDNNLESTKQILYCKIKWQLKSEHTSADPKQSSTIVKLTVSYLNIQDAAHACYKISIINTYQTR